MDVANTLSFLRTALAKLEQDRVRLKTELIHGRSGTSSFTLTDEEQVLKIIEQANNSHLQVSLELLEILATIMLGMESIAAMKGVHSLGVWKLYIGFLKVASPNISSANDPSASIDNKKAPVLLNTLEDLLVTLCVYGEVVSKELRGISTKHGERVSEQERLNKECLFVAQRLSASVAYLAQPLHLFYTPEAMLQNEGRTQSHAHAPRPRSHVIGRCICLLGTIYYIFHEPHTSPAVLTGNSHDPNTAASSNNRSAELASRLNTVSGFYSKAVRPLQLSLSQSTLMIQPLCEYNNQIIQPAVRSWLASTAPTSAIELSAAGACGLAMLTAAETHHVIATSTSQTNAANSIDSAASYAAYCTNQTALSTSLSLFLVGRCCGSIADATLLSLLHSQGHALASIMRLLPMPARIQLQAYLLLECLHLSDDCNSALRRQLGRWVLCAYVRQASAWEQGELAAAMSSLLRRACNVTEADSPASYHNQDPVTLAALAPAMAATMRALLLTLPATYVLEILQTLQRCAAVNKPTVLSSSAAANCISLSLSVSAQTHRTKAIECMLQHVPLQALLALHGNDHRVNDILHKLLHDTTVGLASMVDDARTAVVLPGGTMSTGAALAVACSVGCLFPVSTCAAPVASIAANSPSNINSSSSNRLICDTLRPAGKCIGRLLATYGRYLAQRINAPSSADNATNIEACRLSVSRIQGMSFLLKCCLWAIGPLDPPPPVCIVMVHTAVELCTLSLRMVQVLVATDVPSASRGPPPTATWTVDLLYLRRTTIQLVYTSCIAVRACLANISAATVPKLTEAVHMLQMTAAAARARTPTAALQEIPLWPIPLLVRNTLRQLSSNGLLGAVAQQALSCEPSLCSGMSSVGGSPTIALRATSLARRWQPLSAAMWVPAEVDLLNNAMLRVFGDNVHRDSDAMRKTDVRTEGTAVCKRPRAHWDPQDDGSDRQV